MNVADMGGGMEGDPGMMPPGMEGIEGMPGMEGQDGEGMPLWGWIAIGGGALILLVAVITGIRRKKRRKELTEAI
jgi:hypothetical protein